jgi:hypothetical protein
LFTAGVISLRRSHDAAGHLAAVVDSPGMGQYTFEVTEYRSVPEFPRVMAGSDGSIVGPSGKILAPMVDQDGYQRVSMYLGQKRWKRVGVHALVCSAFYGVKPADADLVAHADGNPANNRASNLRWATFVENERDKFEHGRSLRGEGHHRHKLTEVQVIDIRSRYASGEAIKGMSAEFGVSYFAIWAVVKRKTWRHL